MSFPRFIVGALSAAAILALVPTASHAQATNRTACNDGSTASSVGKNVCEGHGGINKGKTAVLNRAPKQEHHAGVTQAGTPAPASHPKYEERRGWRWQRHHDERKAEEKHDRVKCHDGRWTSAEGKNKKDVCRHHGGLAH